MPSLALLSAQPLAGKTTIAAGLVQLWRRAGKTVGLSRLEGDEHGAADGRLLATLADAATGTPEISIIEAASGQTEAPAGARALVVAAGDADAGQAAALCKSAGAAGLIVNRVPVTRLESVREAYAAAGLTPLALVPEDRLLAAPVLSEVAAAIEAEVSFLDGNGGRPLDRALIASISADPAQGYFSRYGATAVIVRSDKPDLQLAALNAGASCLIVTGGLPILSYVLERAEADEIPLLRTKRDTLATVSCIEGLFATSPFAGGEAKLRRIAELMSGLDLAALLG